MIYTKKTDIIKSDMRSKVDIVITGKKVNWTVYPGLKSYNVKRFDKKKSGLIRFKNASSNIVNLLINEKEENKAPVLG